MQRSFEDLQAAGRQQHKFAEFLYLWQLNWLAVCRCVCVLTLFSSVCVCPCVCAIAATIAVNRENDGNNKLLNSCRNKSEAGFQNYAKIKKKKILKKRAKRKLPTFV